MPIYNCEKYLPKAIESIFGQTFTNWELILCDDGSTDQTYKIALEYANKHPKKIILIKNPKNLGTNRSLNKCLKLAQSNLIARMDGDDTCSPERLQIEFDFLASHPEFAIVSCDMNMFDSHGVWGTYRFPSGNVPPSEIVKRSPFCHAGCLVKKEAFDKVNGYSVGKKFVRVEDYDLWIKMYAAGFRGYGLGLPLYSMRDDQDAYKRRTFQNYINEAHAKRFAVRALNLPKWNYALTLRPYIVMLLPKKLYNYLHKKNSNNTN